MKLDINYSKIKIKIISCFLISVFSFLFFVAPASAEEFQQYIRVTPIISELKIVAGKPTSFDLKVTNLANAPLGIHAEVANLDEIDTSDAGMDTSPLIKWTNLSEKDFIVDVKQDKTIRITINPPKNIKESGYYEAIYLTPFVAGQKSSDKPVVLSRIGALVFATYGDLNYKNLKQKVSIDKFSPTHFSSSKSEYSLDLDVKNNYFTHFTAKPQVTVTQVFGKPQKTELEEKHILPGRTRSWQTRGPLKNWGIYKANLVLSVGAGEQVHAESWFVFLPFADVFIYIAILLIIILITFGRKRLGKSVKAFLRKS